MNWKPLIKSLPRGLSFTEVARRLRQPYQSTRYAIRRYGYRAVDGRKFQNRMRKLIPEKVDWKKRNVDIARELGVSRERVRVLRRAMKKRPVGHCGRNSV